MRARPGGPAVPFFLPIILLAVASTVRPTSLAAVYAMLDRGDSPPRLLLVYVAAGLLFTVAFGVLVVSTFSGVQIHSGTDRTKGVAEIAGGVLAIGVGLGVLSGRIPRRREREPDATPGRWSQLLSRRITMRTAAVAGPATHVPGLLYVLALDLIVSNQRHLAGSIVYLLAYNAIWFALPIAALAACIVNPSFAGRVVAAVQSWTSRHARPLVLFVSFAAGAAFLVSGLLTV